MDPKVLLQVRDALQVAKHMLGPYMSSGDVNVERERSLRARGEIDAALASLADGKYRPLECNTCGTNHRTLPADHHDFEVKL